MNPKVSIIVTTYNRRDLVIRCLESCSRQDYPLKEIIVVVNPAGDGTAEAVRNNFPNAKIIRNQKNIGFFPALNHGIKSALGDFIMTVDDDAYFKDDKAISTFIRAFQDEPELGALTCNIEGTLEVPPEAADRYIPQFKTGFTMLPREAFTEWVGFYPDLFFRSAGETYMCTMLWELKKPVKCLSKVFMYHESALGGRKDWDWKFYGLRSQVLCSIMREPWFLIIPALLIKAFKSLPKFIAWKHFSTWLLVWPSALFCMPKTLKTRQPISWWTRKLLWRLQKNVITDIKDIQ